MIVEDEIIHEQLGQLTKAYEMLQGIMEEDFFKSFSDGIEKLLPLVCNLERKSGIRRAELNGEVFFVYLYSEDNNPMVTSRSMAGSHLRSVTIHQSVKPLIIDDKPETLIIEHYVLEKPLHGILNITLRELQDEYARQFGPGAESQLAEVYARLNYDAIADLEAARLAQCLHWFLAAQSEEDIQTGVEEWNADSLCLTVATTIPCGTEDFCAQLFEVINSAGLVLSRCYFREITHNDDVTDFAHMPSIVATVYLNAKPGEHLDKDKLEALMDDIRLIDWVEMNDVLHKELVKNRKYSLACVNWIRSAAEFIHGQLAFVNRNAYTDQSITRYLAVYPELSYSIFRLFDKLFNPALPRPDKIVVDNDINAIQEEIGRIHSGNHDKDTLVKTIFKCMLNYLQCIRKTNFYCKEKSSIIFRLSPDFVQFYRTLGEQYTNAFPPDIPTGVFFMYRRGAFGYHVRFAEIARGGWRTVIPRRGEHPLEMYDNYDFARDEAYREVFVLANTQHLKNKDIFEGGAKLLTLMVPLKDPAMLKPTLWQNQRSFTRAFMSLVNYDENRKLKDKGIVDLLGTREIIEVGPDENLFDTMIDWMGKFATKSGYTLGSEFISGKPGAGINHKHYGVTSFGILQYLLKTLDELKIDPKHDSFTLKIAGGPGGDVAGNEMKLLLADGPDGKPVYPGLKIIAITDGPAAAYDPEGIDRDELKKLILKRNLDAFDPRKLHGDGATMIFSNPVRENGEDKHRQVTVRRTGTTTEYVESMIDRDAFMLLFQNNLTHYADVFFPGGGRPSTINENNWQDFFPDGKPSFRAIVEGANSYITPSARKLIQQRGVWIVKDASANKCGVITSSYEILSGLILGEKEFGRIKDELVQEVMVILKHRAVQEANWLYSKFRSSGTPMTELTEKLSREINAQNDLIKAFLAQHPDYVTDELLLSHLPPIFRKSYTSHLSNLIDEYKHAVASVELACRMVYAEENTNLATRLLALMTDAERKAVKA